MEWSSEELSFFTEGYVFTFNQPVLVSRIHVGDDTNAKYMTEVYGTRDSNTTSFFKLHFRIFEQNEEELTSLLYEGKIVREICLEFINPQDSDFLRFYTPEILLEGNSSFESMSMEPSLELTGLSLMIASKVLLANVMRYLSSPSKNKTKKVINTD